MTNEELRDEHEIGFCWCGAHHENLPWQTIPMECPVCEKKWQAVHPVEAQKLECPGCGYFVTQE